MFARCLRLSFPGCLLFVSLSCVCLAAFVTAADAEPVRIIYETDFTFDVDDVGGLAMLHALADAGEAELIGVSYNEVHQDAVAAIDAVNTWYGRGTIPIGTYSQPLAEPDNSGYLSAVAKAFPSDTKPTTTALEMYKWVLSKQPDQSVVISSVGFTNNLYDLLKDPLGMRLVKAKVKLLAVMGSPRNDGFNLNRHKTADQADYVIRHWPGRVVISFEGGRMCTGNGLLKTSEENPVRGAYIAATPWLAIEHGVGNRCKNEGDEINQPSWDQVATLFAVRHATDKGKMFVVKTDGTVNTRGNDPMPYAAGKLEYIRTTDKEKVRAEIERLMVKPPRDRPAP